MTTTDWSTWEVGGLGIWYCGDDSSYYNGSVVFRSTALIVVGVLTFGIAVTIHHILMALLYFAPPL